MGKIKSDKGNFAIPGEAMDQQQFEQMIKEAEKGPFYSMNELKTAMAKWKAKYSK